MVTMSQKEFQRVKVIENAAGMSLSVREASRLLHLSERQVQRLKRRYQPDSLSWVQHRNRGRGHHPLVLAIQQMTMKYRHTLDDRFSNVQDHTNVAAMRGTVTVSQPRWMRERNQIID
jgi:hypothetical protein